jgi:hypothetical protein
MDKLLLGWRVLVCFISKGLLLAEALTRTFASIFIQQPLEGEHGDRKEMKCAWQAYNEFSRLFKVINRGNCQN